MENMGKNENIGEQVSAPSPIKRSQGKKKEGSKKAIYLPKIQHVRSKVKVDVLTRFWQVIPSYLAALGFPGLASSMSISPGATRPAARMFIAAKNFEVKRLV